MPLVAGLAPAALALLALLILIGGYLLVELIGHALTGSIHIPGLSTAVGWIENGFKIAINAMLGMLSGIVRGIESIITRPAQVISDAFRAADYALNSMANWIRQLINVYVPAIYQDIVRQVGYAIQYAHDLVTSLVNNVIQWVTARLSQIIDFVTFQIAHLQAWVIGLADQLAGDIRSAITYTVGVAESLYRAAMGALSSAISTLEADIINAVARLEKYAQDLANWAIQQSWSLIVGWAIPYIASAIGGAFGGVDAIVAGEMEQVWPRIIDSIKGSAMAIPEGIQWILDRLRGLPLSIPVDIASAIGALALATSIPLEYMERCGAKMCHDLGGFGQETSNLLSEALTAAMLGFVAAAVVDPEGVAAAVDDFAVEPLAFIGDEFYKLATAL